MKDLWIMVCALTISFERNVTQYRLPQVEEGTWSCLSSTELPVKEVPMSASPHVSFHKGFQLQWDHCDLRQGIPDAWHCWQTSFPGKQPVICLACWFFLFLLFSPCTKICFITCYLSTAQRDALLILLSLTCFTICTTVNLFLWGVF